MFQMRTVHTFLLVCAVGAGSGGILRAQDMNFKLADFNGKNSSLLKAEIEARKFIASPSNKGPVVLKFDYFRTAATSDYDVGGGQKLTLESSNYILAAVLLGNAMRELVKDTSHANDKSDELAQEWLTRQIAILASFSKSTPPVLEKRALSAWNQFLLKWIDDARKGGDFRSALQEASFEMVDVMVRVKDEQLDEVQDEAGGGGPRGSSGNSFTSSSSTAHASGAYFPMHERLMNHIYHTNDRRISKAERIRARR